MVWVLSILLYADNKQIYNITSERTPLSQVHFRLVVVIFSRLRRSFSACWRKKRLENLLENLENFCGGWKTCKKRSEQGKNHMKIEAQSKNSVLTNTTRNVKYLVKKCWQQKYGDLSLYRRVARL